VYTAYKTRYSADMKLPVNYEITKHCLIWQKHSVALTDVTMGGKGGTMPRASHHWRGAEKS